MNSSVSILLAASLGTQPLAATTLTANSQAPKQSLAELVEAVQATEVKVNEDPTKHREELLGLLQSYAQFTEEAAQNPVSQEARTYAFLSLARAYLSLGVRSKASEIVDETIRTYWDAQLPVESFGPNLRNLYRERVKALEAQGTMALEIHCRKPCRIYLNERPAKPQEPKLWLGTYRLAIYPETPNATKPLTQSLTLTQAGTVQTLTYPDSAAEPKKAKPVKAATKAYKRLLPRWAEITGLVVGTAAFATGLALSLLKDGQCFGKCEYQFDERNRPAGIALAAIGGALMISGGVTLGIDEARLSRHKKAQGTSAMIHFSFRF